MAKKADKLRSYKKTFYLSILTIFTSLVAAQDGIDFGGGGVAEDSMLGLISEIIGVQISSPVQFIGVASSVAIFGVFWYIILKVGTEKIGIKDTLTPGRNGGKNIIAIMAALITLSAFGSGYVGQLIGQWQDLVVFTWAGGILVALVYALVGGIKFSATGLGSISASNKLEKAKVKKKEADAEEKLKEAENRLKEARKEDEQGMPEDAVRDIERALARLQEGDADIEQIIEADIQELRSALSEIKDELNVERDEIEDEKRMQQVLEDMKSRVEAALAVDGTEEGPFERAYRSRLGFNERSDGSIEEDLEALVKLLQDVESDEKRAREEIEDEVQRLERAANELMQSVKLVRQMENILSNSEAEWEHLAERMGETDEIHVEEGQLEQLEAKKDEIEELEREAVRLLEETRELLSQQVKVTQEELEILQRELKEENMLADKMLNLIPKMETQLGSENNLVREMQAIAEKINDEVMPEVERLDKMDEQELEMEKNVASEIDQVLNQLSQ